MKLLAYYNEIDTFCCAWLSNLMDVGVITPGYIDNRSIEDVTPDDVSGYTRVGFFAGIGVWDYALRLAGWPEDRPVWHGSCPCQPFSIAGKGKGTADERHLWPEFARLIGECRPATVFGEQVASKAGRAWLNDVRLDLEALGYGVGAADLCSASFGAPHIRQRLYWVGADTLGNAALRGRVGGEMGNEAGPQCPTPGGRENEGCWRNDVADDGACVRLAHADNTGRQLLTHAEPAGICGKASCQSKQVQQLGTDGPSTCGLAHAQHDGRSGPQGNTPQQNSDRSNIWLSDRGHIALEGQPATGPTNGFWGAADWLLCRDGKWRATQSIAIEMADGLADSLGYSRFGDRWSLNPLIQKAENRVGRLKGYGNAINAEQAKAFIEAFMEVN